MTVSFLRIRWLAVLAVLAIAAVLGACSDSSTPTQEQTATATPSPVPTPTAIPTATPTAIPTATPTAIPTATPTAIPTPAPTAIPTPTPTPIPRAASPPPTWIFAEGISERHQAILREEMESVRAYFSDRFDGEATGFTVLVGEYEAMSPIFLDLTGGDLSSVGVSPDLRGSHAWVTGGHVLCILYGYDHDLSLRYGTEALLHEYFHVLQSQLASGSEQYGQSPFWLVEGLAVYAEYAAYAEHSGGRDPWTVLAPYESLAIRGAREPDFLENLSAELARIEDAASFQGHGSHLDWTSYELSFIASVFLIEEQAREEDSLVNYWKLLGNRSTWQQAFEEAFGISLDGFYAAFDKWALSLPFPRVVKLEVQLRLPEGQFTDFPGWGWAEFESWRDNFRETWEGGRPSVFSFESLSDDTGTLEVYYTQGSVGTSYLSLYWSDGGTREMCLRGWYKDGSLTPRKEDATAVEFTGKSANIDWTLPAHPSTLPSLGSCWE